MPKRKDLTILNSKNEATAEEIQELEFNPGEEITERYEVVKLLGVGEWAQYI